MEKEVLLEIRERLESLGFGESLKNLNDLTFHAHLVYDLITRDINRNEIPESLHYIYIDMVCGYYLEEQYELGKLESLLSKEIDPASVSSIKVGNVNVGLGTGESDRDRLLSLINNLKTQSGKRYLFDYERRAYI